MLLMYSPMPEMISRSKILLPLKSNAIRCTVGVFATLCLLVAGVVRPEEVDDLDLSPARSVENSFHIASGGSRHESEVEAGHPCSRSMQDIEPVPLRPHGADRKRG